MANKRLTLEDFSDRELLFAFERAANTDGHATSQEIADCLGMTVDNPHRSVAMRMAYLRRHGIVGQDEDRAWFITVEGREFMHGSLKRSQQNAMASLTQQQMLAVTQQLSSEYGRLDPMAAVLMNRAWRWGVAARRRAMRPR